MVTKSAEQESKRILNTHKEEPNNFSKILGLSGKINSLKVYKRYIELKDLFNDHDSEILGILGHATDRLLSDHVDRKQTSTPFMTILWVAVIFSSATWIYMLHGILWDINIYNLLGSIALAYLVVDFMSGIVHMSFDHFIPFTMPIFGDIALDFNFHHQDPGGICRKRPREVVKNFIVFTLAPLTLMGLAAFLMGSPFMTLAFFWGTLFVQVSQLCHRLSHFSVPPNSFVAWLQKMKIILPPRAHSEHHSNKEGEQHQFCIFAGVCNPLLNWMAPTLLKWFTVDKKWGKEDG